VDEKFENFGDLEGSEGFEYFERYFDFEKFVLGDFDQNLKMWNDDDDDDDDDDYQFENFQNRDHFDFGNYHFVEKIVEN